MLIDYELVCNVLLNSIFSLDCACLCSAAWSEPHFMVVGVSKAVTFLCVEWGLVSAWSRHKLSSHGWGGCSIPGVMGIPSIAATRVQSGDVRRSLVMRQLRLCGKLEGSI